MYHSPVDPLRWWMDGGSNSTKFEVLLQGNYLGPANEGLLVFVGHLMVLKRHVWGPRNAAPKLTAFCSRTDIL